jgi:hypothetical protein
MSKEDEKKLADLEEKLKRISNPEDVTVTRAWGKSIGGDERDRRDVGH